MYLLSQNQLPKISVILYIQSIPSDLSLKFEKYQIFKDFVLNWSLFIYLLKHSFSISLVINF